ncbi:hypothetical protein A2482_00170 [Candidatus Falkowbacteria bacterium RIFOXYC2_FULL_48_21]|uniref:Uncharacterized protein n=1 Tax=Candidatus Falkowbacteria bacterium RIFOXYC2_FULL_48_21 TaxID=1798005 RepID=A0A1F5TEY5_9BACT|nr:MAG: hypothetical protein A2482_00170 [Candidatus Falkowbacteria bacterium RIFOXYC2_FULL_48_21]
MKEQIKTEQAIPEITDENQCVLFVKYRPAVNEEDRWVALVEQRKAEKLRRSRRFDFWEYVASLLPLRKRRSSKGVT